MFVLRVHIFSVASMSFCIFYFCNLRQSSYNSALISLIFYNIILLSKEEREEDSNSYDLAFNLLSYSRLSSSSLDTFYLRNSIYSFKIAALPYFEVSRRFEPVILELSYLEPPSWRTCSRRQVLLVFYSYCSSYLFCFSNLDILYYVYLSFLSASSFAFLILSNFYSKLSCSLSFIYNEWIWALLYYSLIFKLSNSFSFLSFSAFNCLVFDSY